VSHSDAGYVRDRVERPGAPGEGDAELSSAETLLTEERRRKEKGQQNEAG
jgi:hypothetical protein